MNLEVPLQRDILQDNDADFTFCLGEEYDIENESFLKLPTEEGFGIFVPTKQSCNNMCLPTCCQLISVLFHFGRRSIC